MIGIFDSGLGGLTVLRALVERFPTIKFVYLGDHANVPYGNRESDDVIDLTRRGVEALFTRGATLVILGCNTATAVAARPLQQQWLPQSSWRDGQNVLGIVAPTVEAATQTPWAVTTPQYPQKLKTDRIAVFGTTRTVASGVYEQEILKRCPKVEVIQQPCTHLAAEIEAAAPLEHIETIIKSAVEAVLARTNSAPPDHAILGCTHYPLVEDLFRKHLPRTTRILSQPDIVADSFDDYLARHPRYLETAETAAAVAPTLLTTGNSREITDRSKVFWPGGPAFESIELQAAVRGA